MATWPSAAELRGLDGPYGNEVGCGLWVLVYTLLLEDSRLRAPRTEWFKRWTTGSDAHGDSSHTSDVAAAS